MGANIGTTVTAWIISALGFKVDIAAFALPLLAFGIPLLFSGKSNRKSIGEFIFGFSFLFMGLSYLKNNAPDLNAKIRICCHLCRTIPTWDLSPYSCFIHRYYTDYDCTGISRHDGNYTYYVRQRLD